VKDAGKTRKMLLWPCAKGAVSLGGRGRSHVKLWLTGVIRDQPQRRNLGTSQPQSDHRWSGAL